jgi:hypothetical protein
MSDIKNAINAAAQAEETAVKGWFTGFMAAKPYRAAAILLAAGAAIAAAIFLIL